MHAAARFNLGTLLFAKRCHVDTNKTENKQTLEPLCVEISLPQRATADLDTIFLSIYIAPQCS